MISYQPWQSGATDPSWLIPLALDSGADNIANYGSFVLIFQGVRNGQQGYYQGTGTLTIQGTSPASILYQPSPQDVQRFVGNILIEAINTITNQKTIWGPIPFVIS